jgi:GT2 family glycosyltransferase
MPEWTLVVDNGSSPPCDTELRERFADVRVLRLDANLGFAGGVNQGIREALAQGAEFVWLLNSDLQVPADALERLEARGIEPAGASDGDASGGGASGRVGMVAPVLVEPDGQVQAWGGGVVDLRSGISRHVLDDREPPDYLTGACLLLRADMLADVGLFDERYFFYFEDADLGFRARAGGWRLAVVEGCRVPHQEGSSLGRWSRRRWQMMFAGLALFLDAYGRRPRAALLLRLLHHSAAMARHRRWEALVGAWVGALHGRGR